LYQKFEVTISLFSKFAFVFVVILLSACAVAPAKKQPPPFWPKPPDPPRFIYETSLRSESSVIRPTPGEKFRQIVSGVDKKKLIAYEKPLDIAARNGRVVVSDTMVNSLVMFDLVNNRLLRIGHLKYGRLIDPYGVAMDYLLNIYVADAGARTIKIYDDVGYFLGSVGDSTSLEKPIDVAVNPTGDRIYVVDSGGVASMAHRVVVFDREGKVLKTIGTRGGNDGNFNLPRSAAVAPDGTLYVLDAGNFRVQAFDRDGNFLRKWGKVGRNIGDFARPRGIAVDDDGNVYVTDAGYRNFQIFNPQGQLLMWIGGPDMNDKPGQYAMPAGIAVDETNRIYVVDQLHKKIEVIRRVTDDESKRILLDYEKSEAARIDKILPARASDKATSEAEPPKEIKSESPAAVQKTPAKVDDKAKNERPKEINPGDSAKKPISPAPASDKAADEVGPSKKIKSEEEPAAVQKTPAKVDDKAKNERPKEINPGNSVKKPIPPAPASDKAADEVGPPKEIKSEDPAAVQKTPDKIINKATSEQPEELDDN